MYALKNFRILLVNFHVAMNILGDRSELHLD